MLSGRPTFAVLLAFFASLSACALPSAESSEQELISDDAQAIKGGAPATEYPESVLLLMKVGGKPKELCSGSLVAPKVVLTAGHCVRGFDTWDITAPFANGQKSFSTTTKTLDWTNDQHNIDPNMHDVALVFLDTPINIAAYPTIAANPLADGDKLVHVGRINNGQLSYTSLYASKPLAVKSAKSIGFPFDYTASETIEPGDSGGPDFIPGTHTIVSVNSGGGGGTEILARVDLVHDWLVEQIGSAGGGSGDSGAGGGTDNGGAASCSGGGGTDDGRATASGSGGGGTDDGGGSSGAGPVNPGGPGGSGGNSSYCPGLPPFGYCYYNMALSCQQGVVRATNCSALGKRCGFDGAQRHFVCR